MRNLALVECWTGCFHGNPMMKIWKQHLLIGSSQTWLFQTWLFAVLRSCALLRPFALFCGLVFALFCGHLRSFARICMSLRPTAFRTPRLGTADLNTINSSTSRKPRKPRDNFLGCGFFAYSWELPAYSGAFLLTIDMLSFFTYN